MVGVDLEPLLPQQPEEPVSPTVTETRGTETRTSTDNDGAQAFSVSNEMWEMSYLGFPIAISIFCRLAMSSTDRAFVGHIHGDYTPEIYLSAAVLCDVVINICMSPPLAFSHVLNALVERAIGSGDRRMAGVWLQQSMFWLTITMLPCLIGILYVEPILVRLNFSEEVAVLAGTYARYNLLWPIPNGLYQCMRFYFQAQGHGLQRPAMYNNILFLFINALLNWIFVFGGPFQYFDFFGRWHGLGFIGAAVSLSISRTLQPIVYYLYMFVYKKHHRDTWPNGGCALSSHTLSTTLEFMKQTVPNIGTILFQSAISQVTTVLIGQLGTLSVAASETMSAVTTPWLGTLSWTTCTVSGVRVGHHLGRGDAEAARKSAWIVIHFITIQSIIMVAIYLPLRRYILMVSTDDPDVLDLAAAAVPAMLVANYISLLVGNITSGVFTGMGRPFIAGILSFGLELPLSIGGLAVYILHYHGDLLGAYWWQAIVGAIELVIVMFIFLCSDWKKCAIDTRMRQEAQEYSSGSSGDEDENDTDDTEPSIC